MREIDEETKKGAGIQIDNKLISKQRPQVVINKIASPIYVQEVQ
jgi:hypothetical protein